MAGKIVVTYKNRDQIEFNKGVTLYEVSKHFQSYYNYPIIAARLDNDIVGLNETITRNSDVKFYDRSSYHGNSTYGRTLQFILIVAVEELFNEKAEVTIEHSIDKGFYCEIVGVEIDEPQIKKLEKHMKEIVKTNKLISKLSVSRLEAIKYFKAKKQFVKSRNLKYTSNTYINIHELNGVYDYFYGDLAYSTGVIDDFKLTYIKDNGFVVSFPDVYNPECTLDYKHHKRLFDTFLNYTKWGRTVKVSNAADLNDIVSRGEYGDLIRLSEAYYNSQLSNISEKIYQAKNRIKMILIAGPSSSGKTTSSKKLEIYLRSRGIHTYRISIDDYFKDRDETPINSKGEPDFESLNAIDVTKFNLDLSKLLNGEKVLLPEYNFILGKKEYKKRWLQLKENEMIIIEGLHSLNDDLTPIIERRAKYKIYLSPLTQLNIDPHNRIHTSDIRKLRRIVRDNKFRGYSASETLKMWKNIRYGEEQYIFPFQDHNDSIINSALLYEIGVLRTYAEPLLYSVSPTDSNYPEAIRLINLLRNFLTIPSEEVPEDSILREFIGNSCFY